MAEDKKKDERIKVNVIKKAPQPAAQPPKASHEGEGEVEKKVIVLKKKPTIVVKVKEKEEEKHESPVKEDAKPLSETELKTTGPKVIPYDKSKLPPINPEPRKVKATQGGEKAGAKEAAPKETVVLTGKSFMTNTAVHHQNSRIQSPLHNGPVIIKSADLPPVPGQKVEGGESADAPHRPRVAGIVGGRPAGGYRQQGGQRRFPGGQRPQGTGILHQETGSHSAQDSVPALDVLASSVRLVDREAGRSSTRRDLGRSRRVLREGRTTLIGTRRMRNSISSSRRRRERSRSSLPFRSQSTSWRASLSQILRRR